MFENVLTKLYYIKIQAVSDSQPCVVPRVADTITLMRIRIQHFTLMWIRIQLFTSMLIPTSSSSKWWESAMRPLVFVPSRAPFWASMHPLWASTALNGFILSFWILRIRIQHFTLMWIQIQLFTSMRIPTSSTSKWWEYAMRPMVYRPSTAPI